MLGLGRVLTMCCSMTQWRRPPAVGSIKTPFGRSALVEVGVTVTLDFEIPKHLVTFFIRNCQRYRYCSSALGGIRRVGCRCRLGTHFLRDT